MTMILSDRTEAALGAVKLSQESEKSRMCWKCWPEIKQHVVRGGGPPSPKNKRKQGTES